MAPPGTYAFVPADAPTKGWAPGVPAAALPHYGAAPPAHAPVRDVPALLGQLDSHVDAMLGQLRGQQQGATSGFGPATSSAGHSAHSSTTSAHDLLAAQADAVRRAQALVAMQMAQRQPMAAPGAAPPLHAAVSSRSAGSRSGSKRNGSPAAAVYVKGAAKQVRCIVCKAAPLYASGLSHSWLGALRWRCLHEPCTNLIHRQASISHMC